MGVTAVLLPSCTFHPVFTGSVLCMLYVAICMHYSAEMGVTVQVRDLDADVQQKLRDGAAREGLTLSAFLRRELTRVAARVEAESMRDRWGISPAFFAGISAEEIVAMVREDRDR